MLTSEVLTIVVSRVDNNRLKHRLQRVSFMIRVAACLSAQEPEGEQVQAPSDNVVTLVLDLEVLRLGDSGDLCGDFIIALLMVEYVCGLV